MSEPIPPPKSQVLAVMNRAFRDGVPHNAALGLELIDVGPGEGYAAIRLPYSEQLVGDPETGILHGGAITALIDATCGAAVFMKLAKPVPIATIDLRIDYLKPATPGLAVIARAETIKLTRNVGFVRALAYHDGPADADPAKAGPRDPIASAAATFMIGTKGRSVTQRAAKPPAAEDGAPADGPKSGEEP